MKLTMTIVTLLSLAAAPVLVGCGDKEKSSRETTIRRPDGSVSRQRTTVKQQADGDIVTETQRQNR